MNKLRARDRLVSSLSADKFFKATAVEVTSSAKNAIERHQLNPLAATLMTELFVATQLAAASLQGEETLAIKVKCRGSLGGATCETNGTGEVRGYVNEANPPAEGDSRQSMRENALGDGELLVQKWLSASKEPTLSVTPLHYKDIAKDLTWFFFQSEQVPTAIKIDVSLDDNLNVTQALGLMVQALPLAPEERLSEMEGQFASLEPLAGFVSKETHIASLATEALPGYQFKQTHQRAIDFYCRCSKQGFAQRLATLPPKELHEMAEEGSQEIVCHYCHEKYYYTPDDLKNLIP